MKRHTLIRFLSILIPKGHGSTGVHTISHWVTQEHTRGRSPVHLHKPKSLLIWHIIKSYHCNHGPLQKKKKKKTATQTELLPGSPRQEQETSDVVITRHPVPLQHKSRASRAFEHPQVLVTAL